MDGGAYWSSLSTESLRLDGDRDEAKRQRNKMMMMMMRRSRKKHYNITRRCLAPILLRRKEEEEGVVGREERERLGRKPSWKVSVIQAWGHGFDPPHHKNQAW